MKFNDANGIRIPHNEVSESKDIVNIVFSSNIIEAEIVLNFRYSSEYLPGLLLKRYAKFRAGSGKKFRK